MQIKDLKELIKNQNEHIAQKDDYFSNPVSQTIEKECSMGFISLSETSGFLCKMTFLHFFLEILRLSYKVLKKGQMITLKHLQFLSQEQSLKEDLPKFTEIFNFRLKQNNGTISEWQFALILITIFRKKLIIASFCWTLNICSCFIFSFLITQLLESYENNNNSENYYYWSMALSIIFFFQYIAESWGWYTVHQFNTKFCFLIMNSLYLKVMRLNGFCVQKANLGKIINIIANDMSNVEIKFTYLIFLVTAPITLVLSLYFLWQKLGPVGLIAIPIIFIIYFIQKTLSSASLSNIEKKNFHSDQRIKLCTELFEGIRIFKFYAWETTLKKIIDDSREQEIKYLMKYSHFIYASRAISVNSSYIICLSLFFIFNAIDDNNLLNPPLVFSVFLLVEYIKTFQVNYVGFGFSFFFEFKVIIRRIIEILTIEEPSPKNEIPENINLDQNISLVVQNFTGFWDVENENIKPVLKNINMKFEVGKIYGIIGKVGSGKTSFFLSILNEIPKYSGYIKTHGTLAYVEQEPYIIHGTVRNNILFFKEYNEELYRKVLKVSCLKKDLLEFPNKDLTEIGERGVNLSGGQKTRISFARALYSEADIYLFDDPLSSLDAKVGRKIFENGIKKFLKGKTVILATHQKQFLKDVDYIFELDNGEVVKEGSSLSFKEEMPHYFDKNEISSKCNGLKLKKIKMEKKKNNSDDTLEINIEQKTRKGLYEKNAEEIKPQVSIKTYFQFLKYSNSISLAVFCSFLFVFLESLKIGSSYLYSFFGGALSNSDIFLGVFLLLLSEIIIMFLKYYCFLKLFLQSSVNIHKKMTETAVRAPSSFFDTNQLGGILNLFSTDIGLMDSLLVLTLIDFFDLGLNFLSGIIFLGIINFWIFIPGFLAFLALYKVLMISKPVVLALKQLDIENKSPIFGVFASSLNGLSTINVYKKTQNFIDDYSILIDNSARCNNSFWDISRGLGFIVENISKSFSVIGLFTILVLTNPENGLLGLQLVYLLLIAENLQWGLRQAINADSLMSSSLRTFNFIKLPPEDSLFKNKDLELVSQKIKILNQTEEVEVLIPSRHTKITYNELKGLWPKDGHISFDKISLKYREELGPTLFNLSIDIKPGEKIGVVGRTGAGKSSLLQALFRMVELSAGKIEIDGVNTKEIGLHTLRGNISIIPQNPFIFSGSIRRNIDPMNLNNDQELWNALNDVGLKTLVERLSDGIDSDMSNAKQVFSVGQKQLLCLARAILKKNKILVLDEATANIDLETDSLMQAKIKELFHSCTILTIAHRIMTIADYDKVLVLDMGHLVEYDEPFLLLSNEIKPLEITKNGYFADMVKRIEGDTQEEILSIARKSYFMRKSLKK